MDKKPILVNKKYALNPEDTKDFEYEEVLVEVKNEDDITPYDQVVVGEDGKRYIVSYLEKETNDVLAQLKEHMLSKGIKVTLRDAGRGPEKQQYYFDKAVNDENKGLEYAKKYIATPGHSEHETGLAVDLAVSGTQYKQIHPKLKKLYGKLKRAQMFYVLQKEAKKFGFIKRYQLGKKPITGYAHERWHYRYVGKDVAKKMHGMTLESYTALQNLKEKITAKNDDEREM